MCKPLRFFFVFWTKLWIFAARASRIRMDNKSPIFRMCVHVNKCVIGTLFQ